MKWINWKTSIFLGILTFCGVLLFSIFTTKVINISGNSMMPTYYDGERLKVNYSKDIKRGDVVLVKMNDSTAFVMKGHTHYMSDSKENHVEDGGVDIIKRTWGLPGDRVKLKDGRLYINGYEQVYVNAEVRDKDFGILPKNKYLILGDNTSESVDSRYFGFVNLDTIVGKLQDQRPWK